jgi:hypothetical protein
MSDAEGKHNLTQRILMLLSVNYLPRQHDQNDYIVPLTSKYLAAVLGADEDLVEEECEFLLSIGILRKDCDVYALWP